MKGHLPSPFTIFSQQMILDMEKQFWNFGLSGFSYPELSHRSKYYAEVNQQSKIKIKEYFHVPENYEILYLPAECGIPSLAFNLCSTTNNRAVYIVNDRQSQKAFIQAQKVNPNTVRVSTSNQRESLNFQGLFYTFYNKMLLEQGKINEEILPLQSQILVCSLRECAYFESVNISRHGIVMFESGRGIGLLGMSVLIIRKDLIPKHLPQCPDVMDFKMQYEIKSIVNTPFTFVPLLILKQISYLTQQELSLQKVKQKLSKIKQQYIQILKDTIEIKDTDSPSTIIFRKTSQMTEDNLKQYGIVINQWVIVKIQLENEGMHQQFSQVIFSC